MKCSILAMLFAFVTPWCRAETAPIVALPATAGISADGKSVILSVLGDDVNGEAALLYDWQALDVTGTYPLFDSGHGHAARQVVARVFQAGSYHFVVTITNRAGASTSSDVTLSVPSRIVSLGFLSWSATVPIGGSVSPSMFAVDQFGSMVAPPTLTWRPDPALSWDTYRLTPTRVGGPYPFTVTAGGLSATMMITCVAQADAPGAPVVFDVAGPSTITGTTITLTANAGDDLGEAQLSYGWSSLSYVYPAWTASRSGSNAAKSTVITFGTSGSYVILLTVTNRNGLSTYRQIPVSVVGTPNAITLAPTDASVLPGGNVTIAPEVRDQFGNVMTVPPDLTWSVTGGGTISSGGTFTAGPALGEWFAVSAAWHGAPLGRGTVSVVSPPIFTAPASITPQTDGLNLATTPPAVYAHGSGRLLYRWQILSGSGWQTANVPPDAFSGMFAWTGSGHVQLQVTASDGDSVSVSQQVGFDVAAVPTRLSLLDADQIVLSGQQAQFHPDLFDQFGAFMGEASVVAWTLSGGGTITPAGRFSAGPLAGRFTLTATAAGLQDTVTVWVAHQAPTVVVGQDATATPSIVYGGTTSRLTIAGADDDPATALTYTWVETSTGNGMNFPSTFANNGTNAARNTIITFHNAGLHVMSCTITDAGHLSVASSPITIDVRSTLGGLAIYPDWLVTHVQAGATMRFQSAALDQFGHGYAAGGNVTSSTAWSTTGGGTIGSGTSSGVFVAGSTPGGPFTVRGTFAGFSATVGVIIDPVPVPPTILSGPTVTRTGPATFDVSVGARVNDGSSAPGYAWTVGGNVPFTVDPGRADLIHVTCFRAGTTPVGVTVWDATNHSTTATTTIVLRQILTAVHIAPSSVRLGYGETAAFTSLPVDQFGDAIYDAPTPVWTITGGGALASAVFTAGRQKGHWLVQASIGSTIGVASLNVLGDRPHLISAPVVTWSSDASHVGIALTATGDSGAIEYTWRQTQGMGSMAFNRNGRIDAGIVDVTLGAPPTSDDPYQVELTMTDGSGLSATVPILLTFVPVVTSLVIRPAHAQIPDDAPFRFDVRLFDQRFQPIAATVASWSVSGGGWIEYQASGTSFFPEHLPVTDVILTARVGAVSATTTFSTYEPTLFATRINFQPASAPRAPSHLVDAGEAYGLRHGLSYGWNAPVETRDRNAIPDQSRDTLALMQAPSNPSARWELAVPNGTYQIDVVCGDPSFFDGNISLLMEGAVSASGRATAAMPFISASVTRTVADGRLTITNGAGSFNTKLCWISVRQLPTPVSLFAAKVNFQPLTSVVVPGYAIDSGAVFAVRNGLTYGWNAPVDTRDRHIAGDQRLGTCALMQAVTNTTARWELSVPNGLYRVHVVCGDPSYFDGNFALLVEGVLTVSGRATAALPFREGTIDVSVIDGKLTLSNGTGSYNTKICYIEILQIPIGNG